MKQMKVLVACEYSGIVRDAFTRLGHEAWSCDLLPTESPGNHYEGNVFDIIDQGWDLMIAHPPCTYLTVAGNRHIPGNPERWKHRFDAINFVWNLWTTNIPHIAIENPVGVLSTYIGKPSQIIQPYYCIKDRIEDLKGMGVNGIISGTNWFNASKEDDNIYGINI